MENSHEFDYDIVIVGGGMVGVTLACALANQPARIAIIEEKTNLSQETSKKEDTRAIALSYGSCRILEENNLWKTLSPYVRPIKQVHISEKGHLGITRIKAKDYAVDALGYVVRASLLGGTLERALSEHPDINRITPARVKAMQPLSPGFELSLDTPNGERKIRAKLVVAADGAHSTLRQLQNIESVVHDYHQSAIVTSVFLTRDHENVAYERFCDGSVIALLPMDDRQYALIWTVAKAQATEWIDLSDELFLAMAQQQFGYRLGRFLRLGKRQCYPLQLMHTQEQVKPGFVLIGNASRTLHPVAAQGLNLGLQDVALLAKVIKKAISENALHEFSRFKDYEASRQRDQQRMVAFTDGLVRWFSYDFAPVVLARQVGLLALDSLPVLKRQLSTHLMGFPR